MPVLVRMLAVVLVLWTGGAFQASAAVLDAVEECGDEQDCDCSTCLVPCGCCLMSPSLSLPPSLAVQSTVRVVEPVVAPLDAPVVAASAADIFHPPRA